MEHSSLSTEIIQSSGVIVKIISGKSGIELVVERELIVKKNRLSPRDCFFIIIKILI